MQAPIRYRGDLTCALQVTDLERSIGWYRDVLGFRLLYQMPEIGWCELQTPVRGVTVGLSRVGSPHAGSGPVLTFGVVDVDLARASLEADGVRFDGPTREIPGLVKLATFRDPDGNALMFAESLAPA